MCMEEGWESSYEAIQRVNEHIAFHALRSEIENEQNSKHIEFRTI